PQAAVEMMHTIHGVPRETACRLVGLDPKTVQQNDTTAEKPPIPEQTVDQNLMPSKDAVSGTPQTDQPTIDDAIKPTTGTLEQRVAQPPQLFMSRDKLPLQQAVARAIQQAATEGFKPADAGKDGAPAAGTMGENWTPTGMGHDPGHPKKPGEKCEKCKKDP